MTKSASTSIVIENVSQLTQFTESTLQPIDGKSFYFGFNPKYRAEAQSVYIYLICWHSLNVECKVSILSSNNQHQKLLTKKYRFEFNDEKSVHYTEFVTLEQLLNQENHFMTNDQINLQCEIEIIEPKVPLEPIQKDLNSLSENFKLLLCDSKFSEASLVLANGKQFHVHKNILAACSLVFSAMFEHDCEEKRQNRVVITDINEDVCQELLRFVYTGSVEKLDLHAMDLLEVADKYQVDSLKIICEQYLASNLTIESVISVIILSDMHQTEELKSKCVEFILANFDEIKKGEGWKMINTTRPKLYEELSLLGENQ